jgi:CDP-diacylglycerol--glycerol-3-phosphate 3-phosphatidyltransferase
LLGLISFMDQRVIANIPNWLTLARLAATPFIVILLNDPAPWMFVVSAIVVAFAAVTDVLDGFIARRWGVVSDFGALVDPLADKLLVMTSLVMLVAQRDIATGDPWVPAWIVVVILAREIWVTGLRGVAATEGLVLAADVMGKWKSLLQMTAIPLLLLHDSAITIGEIVFTGEWVGTAFLALSLVLSIWSAFDYTYRVFANRRLNTLEPTAPSVSNSGIPDSDIRHLDKMD